MILTAQDVNYSRKVINLKKIIFSTSLLGAGGIFLKSFSKKSVIPENIRDIESKSEQDLAVKNLFFSKTK